MTVVVGTLGVSDRFGDPLVLRDLPSETKTLLRQSTAINSTEFEGLENGVKVNIGSKTETALLENYLSMDDLVAEQGSLEAVFTFLSIPGANTWGLSSKFRKKDIDCWLKERAESILRQSRYVSSGVMTDQDRTSLNNTID